MVEPKKPVAGEWWNLVDVGLVYIIGWRPSGQVVFDADNGGIDWCSYDAKDWTHEPECTGKDWVKPDWVTQDRVPYRKEFDEFRWGDDYVWLKNQSGIEKYRHGDTGSSSMIAQIRCLRNDLPSEKRKVTVSKWLIEFPNGQNRMVFQNTKPDHEAVVTCIETREIEVFR